MTEIGIYTPKVVDSPTTQNGTGLWAQAANISDTAKRTAGNVIVGQGVARPVEESAAQ